MEDGEDCDCGTVDGEECARLDPCCDHITCKLRDQAECSSGPCCDNCKVWNGRSDALTPEREGVEEWGMGPVGVVTNYHASPSFA